jgi:hypothetical protein
LIPPRSTKFSLAPAQAGLVASEKLGARADVQARPAPTAGRDGVIERYRQLWEARFDGLD